MKHLGYIVSVLFGIVAFYAGILYSLKEMENQIDVWDSNYQIITDKVYAFEKVSDPETIRHYVKELNKILDDVTFLGKMVESGQTSAESLDEFFSNYDTMINSVNDRILELNKEHMESVTKFNSQIAGLSEDQDELFDTTEDLEIIIKDQSDYINQLNTTLSQKIKDVEKDVIIIKDSKYGKKIWEIKK